MMDGTEGENEGREGKERGQERKWEERKGGREGKIRETGERNKQRKGGWKEGWEKKGREEKSWILCDWLTNFDFDLYIKCILKQLITAIAVSLLDNVNK